MNCEKRGSGAPIPCHSCNTCRGIEARQFSDVKLLGKENGKAKIGVEEVRAFHEDMFLSATEAESKIYIIENAEALTPASQNALLKVMEEPPEATYIFLLSNGTDQLLSTVKSRVQYIQMQRFSPKDTERYLIERNPRASALMRENREAFEAITLFCSGVIGAALEMLDDKIVKENEHMRKLVSDLVMSFGKRTEFSKLYSALSALPSSRPEFKRALELTLSALRDIYASKSNIDAPLLFFTDRAEAQELTAINAKRLMRIFEIILGALSDVDKNVLIPSLVTDIALSVKNTV